MTGNFNRRAGNYVIGRRPAVEFAAGSTKRMRLSIRWKFILSIGITLIVTYLSLLTWDYWIQRRLATESMQQQVADRAETLASAANNNLNTIEASIANTVNEFVAKPPTTEDAIRAIIGQRNWPQSLQRPTVLFIAFDPAYAESANLKKGYQITLGVIGGRGGRGNPGGGRGGGRGGFNDAPFPGPGAPDAPGGREGRFDPRGGAAPEGQNATRGPASNVRGIQFNPNDNRGSRGRGDGRAPSPEEMGPPPDGAPPRQGGPRGFGQRGPGYLIQNPATPAITLEPLSFDPTAQPFYTRAVEEKRSVWTDPHVIGGAGPQQPARTTFSCPIVVNDKVIGVLAAATTLNNALDFGRRLGPPSTRPAELETAVLLRESSIIGNEGRVIFPLAPRNTQRESIVDWARANGLANLAADLTATFEGENSAVKVYRVHDAPDIVPNAKAGEFYWVAFAPIATTDWVVTSSVSESEYMSPHIQRLWHRALFLVSGLVVLLGVTAFVSIRVARPIEKMARAVNELAHGNLDAHVHEVTSRDEIGQLASAFNTMTGQLKQHVAALTEQTAARETVEAELRIARQIQTDLLPKTFPPFPSRNEFDLYAVNVPAHRVAGDFYDFFFTPDDLLTIVIADVSGKGVPAALLMAVTRTIVRNLAMEGLTPGQIAERANAMLIQDISDSMFVTMFLCQYDTKTGRILYVNAGHPKPYCFGATGDPSEFGDVTGALLGVNPVSADWSYEQREGQLEIGQTLLLYTDGVSEARSPDGQMLRNAGVEQLIRQHQTDDVDHLCKGLVEDVTDYQAGQPADDVTLVALKRRS